MKICAIIPARYQSSRFPGKPLALISGKPMIQHAYERALACPELSAVCIATDDSRITDCVNGFGGKAVMTSVNHRSGTDRIAEAAAELGLMDDDIVVNVQGDQPSFHPSVVTDLVRPLVEDASIPMSTLKCRIREGSDVHNPNHVKVVTDRQGFALYFSRYPVPFCRDGEPTGNHYKHLGFYCFRMDFLKRFSGLSEGTLESLEKLEQLRVLEHGFKIKVVETLYDSIEVDVPEDIGKIEASLRSSRF
mgnify:FL=1